MTELISPTAAEVLDVVHTALRKATGGSPLGKYSRKGLPDTPAIIVGRSLPPGYKVIVAPNDQDPVPALEVIIETFPEFKMVSANFGQVAITESWRIYLVFHDDRQFPRSAIQAITQYCQVVSDIDLLPANDQRPYQYSVLVAYSNRSPQKY
jgi:hypothetical protein